MGWAPTGPPAQRVKIESHKEALGKFAKENSIQVGALVFQFATPLLLEKIKYQGKYRRKFELTCPPNLIIISVRRTEKKPKDKTHKKNEKKYYHRNKKFSSKYPPPP